MSGYADDAPDGYWAPCVHCEGDGLVIDNRSEELVDCPNCDGVGVIYYEDAGEDEYEPDDEE